MVNVRRDAWIEMLRKLENMEMHHHSRPRNLTKEELWGILEALYEVVVEELHFDYKA